MVQQRRKGMNWLNEGIELFLTEEFAGCLTQSDKNSSEDERQSCQALEIT